MKSAPAGVATVDEDVNAIEPGGVPETVIGWLKQYPWLPWAVLIVMVVLGVLLPLLLGGAAGLLAAAAVIGAGAYAFYLLRHWQNQLQTAETLSQSGQTVASVASYPASSNFMLSTPGSSFVPALGGTE